MEEFKKAYLGEIDKETIEKQKRAFDAMLAYERNCILKYDYPDNRPSKQPIMGERMIDFACRFKTTIEEMKQCGGEVERFIENNPPEKKVIAFIGYPKQLVNYIVIDRLIDKTDETIVIKNQQDLHRRVFTDLIVCNYSYESNNKQFTRLIDYAVDHTRLQPQFIGKIRSGFYLESPLGLK